MSSMKQFQHLAIELKAIELATNNFSYENCIGSGGFGKVYRGELVHSKGPIIAAFKRLDGKYMQGNREYLEEILMLSTYQHENIVPLIGFCDTGDETILVYEYASRSSLDLHLNNGDLTWIHRLKICIGAGRGLEYLHNPGGSQQRILHRDLKSANILLDENWNAKISNLGLSKFHPANQKLSFLGSNTVGTIGYCDPSYMETGLLTKESDVYSFGVVLFEVLAGRLCIVENKGSFESLTFSVRQYYMQNKLNYITFGSIKDQINPESFKAFTEIAYQCLKRDREERPSMKDVVTRLDTALEYQIGKLMPVLNQFEHLKIRLEDIISSTNNFAEDACIGKREYGSVYRGELVHQKGHITVALYRLDHAFGKGEPEFRKEINIFSLYRHENIVSLLGICDEHGEKILVYEYVSSRSLDLCVSNNDLTWVQRLNICIGAARGLAHLHSDVVTKEGIMHRNFKSSNIALDEEWNAKITDFGLSKFHSTTQETSPIEDNFVGTVGYCDPLYLETGSLTKESDVYSFGVVLFEVLCGRLCTSKTHNGQSFTVFVRRCYKQNKLDEIIFDNIKDEINSSSLNLFATIAYQCLKRSRKGRPTMKKIVSTLETAITHQVTPPSPSPPPSPPSKSSNVPPLPNERLEKTSASVRSLWDVSHIQGSILRLPKIDIKEFMSLFLEAETGQSSGFTLSPDSETQVQFLSPNSVSHVQDFSHDFASQAHVLSPDSVSQVQTGGWNLKDRDNEVINKQAEKDDEMTVITIKCPDRIGLGCDLCRTILFFGLTIVRYDVSTDGKLCHLVFWVIGKPRMLWSLLKKRLSETCPTISSANILSGPESFSSNSTDVYRIKFCFHDRQGLLHDMIRIICELGFVIKRVEESTTPDGMAMDLFFVTDTRELLHTTKRMEDTHDYLKVVLGDDILSYEIEKVDDPDEFTTPTHGPPSFIPPEITQDMFTLEMSDENKKHEGDHVSVTTDNSLKPAHTLLQIVCQDHKGALYDTMRTLKDYNIQISYGRFSKKRKRSEIELFIVQDDEKKITESELRSRIRIELVRPLRVSLVKRGRDTELLAANPVELSGKGRPLVLYNITLALKIQKMDIFSAEISRHLIGGSEWEVYRVLFNEGDKMLVQKGEIEEAVRKMLMSWDQ